MAALPVATVDNGVLVELAENNEAGKVDSTEAGSALLIIDVEELELLGNSGVLGNIEEDFGVFSANGLTEVGNSELSGFDLLLELGAVNLSRGGSNLLEDPVDNLILSAATSVLDLLALLEEEESGESANAESLSELLLFSGVDLGEVVGRLILGKSLSGLGVLRG